MPEVTDQPAKPPRTWLPMALWIAGILLALCSCGSDRAQKPAKPEFKPVTSGPATLPTFATYNVLADQNRADERLPVLLRILGETSADVIALQEVTPPFAERLLREEWAKIYNTTLGDPRGGVPGGLAILSRLPVEKQEYRRLSGRQGRGVLTVRLRTAGRSLAVATVHLESPLEAGEVRAQQLGEILPLLAGADEAVLMGDFNFGDGEQPETAGLPASFVDLWTALRPGEPGFTWNIEKSPMARDGSFPGEKSRRLDRILLCSKSWAPERVWIVGDEPAVNGDAGLFPSDHFGLLGRICRKPAPREPKP